MAMKSKFLAFLAVPFLLSGCGEGFELVKTDSYFPYGNKRTAGSGYAYVLAKMLPKKELKVEPIQQNVARERAPEIIEPPKAEPMPVSEEPEIKAADPIFHDDGKK